MPFVGVFEEVPFVTVGSFWVVPDEEETSEKDLRTSGDSSASTCRALRAEEAKRWVGKGVRITL